MAVTIYDVAQLAGVVPSTVSRYLNGYGVRGKNRLKIEQAIESLGFKQNLIATGLKRSRLRSIGVLLPNYTIFFMTITAQLERILAQSNYSLLLGNFEDDLALLQTKLDFVEERFIDGLILFSSGVGAESAPRLQQYLQKKLPVVLVEQEIPGISTDAVIVDNAHASFRAVEKLIHENHTRIAIANSPEHIYVFRERLRGYRHAMQTYNLPVDERWIVTGRFVDMGEYAQIQQLFDLPNPPTAIFATTYYATLGTVVAAHQQHLKIPEDISLIGFDHFDPIDALEPPLSLVLQPIEAIAQTAADLLLQRLDGDYANFPQTVTLSTRMAMRESIRKL